MPQHYYPGHLIEAFAIEVDGPAGNKLVGKLYQGRDRPTHRVIRVFDGPNVLAEVEGYDLANATNRLDWWLAKQPFVPIAPELVEKFERGEFKPALLPTGEAYSIDTVYYLRWKAAKAEAAAKAQVLRCDHCGQPTGDHYQQTAESVVCGACIARAKAEGVTGRTMHGHERAADEVYGHRGQFVDGEFRPHSPDIGENGAG